ncbi:MAG TPA: hypothetical protein VEH84_11480 [Alphaproteobacteria bacterium]|nr:hypothetical protein [Alphaproteobacteria bacterium]
MTGPSDDRDGAERPVVAFIDSSCPRCRRVTTHRVEAAGDELSTICNVCRPMDDALKPTPAVLAAVAAVVIVLIGGALATMP